jgi:RNA polymerase sigma-70 factor (ECF subfamily)
MSLAMNAVDELFRRHNRALNGLARRRVGWEDAEDVVQDAYLRLLELENAGRINDARGYLYRIAANLAIDLLRKRKTRATCLVEDAELERAAGGDPVLGASGEEAILLRHVQARLAQLPPACRETFLLSRLYGMTFPEIAERLGISLRTVNRHISRTIDHLQSAFDAEDGKALAAPAASETARRERLPEPHVDDRDRQGESQSDQCIA